jgi:3-oxo-5alpha-steroid 4-dehydrogenase
MSLSPNRTAGVRTGGLSSPQDFLNRLRQWRSYVDEVVPKRIQALQQEGFAQQEWPFASKYDVVVVGFGAAGASAALDAADLGKRVLLIDRFDGGGSTRRSGGVYYAGAGTRAQTDANVQDSPENMFRYLKKENDGAVDDATIMRFCNESPATFAWLEGRVGVPFRNAQGETVYYEKKTSYPPSETTLYQSGNEAAHPFNQIAAPAARGNRAFGDYLTGNVMYNAFERAVANHALITVAMHCKAARVVLDSVGRVRGLDVEALLEPGVQGMHVMLHEIGSGAPMLDQTRYTDQMCAKRETELFEAFGLKKHLQSPAVIVCAGGFLFNQAMVKAHAPKYDSFMPLGNLGDDGSGIALCAGVGAKLARMDRCSAWKFINPPFSFVRGVLVNARGERVGNEDTYGATFADFLVQKHGGKGWLAIDQKVWDEANEDCMNPESGLQQDQRMQGLANLHKNHVKADTWEELAAKCKAPALPGTMREYNAQAAAGGQDPVFHKVAKYVCALSEGPFYAINLNMTGNKYWPTPCMSLGGVCVDGASGLALAHDGRAIPGLYAAGRSAVGVVGCVVCARRSGRGGADSVCRRATTTCRG